MNSHSSSLTINSQEILIFSTKMENLMKRIQVALAAVNGVVNQRQSTMPRVMQLLLKDSELILKSSQSLILISGMIFTAMILKTMRAHLKISTSTQILILKRKIKMPPLSWEKS
jgi:hypothetical protein